MRFSRAMQAFVVVTSLSCVPSLIAEEPASEAAKLFDSVYGPELKRVASTAWTGDDLELAKQLMDAIRSSENTPELIPVLAENAYTLAIKDGAGAVTAIAALEIMDQKRPEKHAIWRQKLLEAREKLFTTASEKDRKAIGEALIYQLREQAQSAQLDGKVDDAEQAYKKALSIAAAVGSDSRGETASELRRVQASRLLVRQAEQLSAKLQADPASPGLAQKLFRLYLIELDNPGKAAEYTQACGDARAAALLPLVAGKVQIASDSAWMDAATWYESLVSQAQTPESTAAMRGHAAFFYKRYLENHTEQDLFRTKAELSLKALEARIGSAAPPKSATPAGVAATSNPLKSVKGVELVTLNEDSIEVWDSPKNGFSKSGVFEKHDIRVKGETPPSCILTHPTQKKPARVVYNIGGKFNRFTGGVSMRDGLKLFKTPLTFKVIGDGRELWSSKPIGLEALETFDVSVYRVQKLEIVVVCPGSEAEAHAIWLNPRLVK